jgi:hypothetical protein
MVSDYGSVRAQGIDILLYRGRYSALCLLALEISSVHICAHSRRRIGLPLCAGLDWRNCMPCRPLVLEEEFLYYLETLNISTDSSQAPSPTIDYPSANSGSLGTTSYDNRLCKADRRTCLHHGRGQRRAVPTDRNSSWFGTGIVWREVVGETVVLLEIGERDNDDIDFDFEVRLETRDHAIRALATSFLVALCFFCRTPLQN